MTDQTQRRGSSSSAPPSFLKAGLLSRCPRCGEGRLFRGFLAMPPACPHCGLDFAPFDSADGPAVFIILIVGFIVGGLALAVESLFAPPYWVHIALWTPLTFILGLGLLRPFKATLIALQYRFKAEEARLHGHDDEQ